jgi:Protein of unknown function (DUF3618)
MSERTEDLRREIDAGRERLGETAGAIGYKTDVPSRARDRVGAVKGRITGAGHRVAGAAPSADDAKEGARQAVGVAQENPLGLAAASIAAGFLIGSLLPRTRLEDERIGPATDALKERAGEVAQEALEHGREAAGEIAGTVREQAGDVVREHGSAVAESAKEHAAEGAAEAREAAGGDRADDEPQREHDTSQGPTPEAERRS